MKNIRRFSIIAVLLIVAILLSVVPVSAYSQSTTSTVSAQTDNCVVWYNGSQWTLSASPTALQAGYYSSAYQMMSSGMRFLNIQVPQGATINQAYLQFTAYSDSASFPNIPVVTTIVGQASSYSQPFTTYLDYTNRQKTSNNITWQINQSWTSGQGVQTPDISYVIQEIVQRSDWYQGGTLTLFWGDFDGDTTSQNGYCRRIYPYGQGTPPKLYINYTWNGSTGSGTTNYDLTTINAAMTSMSTAMTTLQSTVTTQGNDIKAASSKIDSMTATMGQTTQQAVTAGLTPFNNTLAGIATQLKTVQDQNTQTSAAITTLNANIKTIVDQQTALQNQIKAIPNNSGTITILIVLVIILILLNLLIFAALRRSQQQ